VSLCFVIPQRPGHSHQASGAVGGEVGGRGEVLGLEEEDCIRLAGPLGAVVAVGVDPDEDPRAIQPLPVGGELGV